MYRILVVEDNEAYLQSLVRILKENQYLVDGVTNGIDGIDYFSKKDYDLVISDLMMEEINGITFMKAIKKMNPNIKTIILTAEPTENTELLALSLEVDQYLAKGGNTKTQILLKYIEKIIQSDENQLGDKVKLSSASEGIELDLDAREVTKDGVPIKVTRKEFDILKFFLENTNKVLTREDFMTRVWESGEVDVRAIDVHVKKLRAKFNIFSIVSVRGIGYKWNEH